MEGHHAAGHTAQSRCRIPRLHSQARLCFALQYVTPCNTALQDFYAEGADAVVEDLVDVTIDSLFNAIYETGKVEDIKVPPAVPQLPMMTATGQSAFFCFDTFDYIA